METTSVDFMWASTQQVLPVRPTRNRRLCVLEADPDLSKESVPGYHIPIVRMMAQPNVQRAFYQYLMQRDLRGKDWIASMPSSEMLKRWTRAANQKAGKKKVGGGIRATRLKQLQDPITQFTIHLARTHDVYKKRLSRPKEDQAYHESVMEDFEEFMETNHSDI